MPYRGTRREEMYSRERIADSPYYRDALSIGAGYGHDGERMLNAIQQAQRAAFTASGIPGLADMLIADQELWQDIPGKIASISTMLYPAGAVIAGTATLDTSGLGGTWSSIGTLTIGTTEVAFYQRTA